MRLTIAYSEMKKRNLVLTNNAAYQRETLSERPIRQPLRQTYSYPLIVTRKQCDLCFPFCGPHHTAMGYTALIMSQWATTGKNEKVHSLHVPAMKFIG